MGCFDVYCFVCGCSCYPINKDYIKEMMQFYKEYLQKPTSIKSKYYRNMYKAISEYPNFFIDLEKLFVKTKWLDKCSFLTSDNKLIKNVKEISCNGEFKDSKGNMYDQYSNYNNYDFVNRCNGGLFIHNDCIQFVKKNYSIDIRFSDVPVFTEKNLFKKINKLIDYGLIEKYREQYFNYIDCTLDSNQYMCENPLTNTKNATRIKKIISQLKLNTDLKRAGPPVSATLYPQNTIKFGLNNKIWIKKNGKWMEIKEPIETIEIEVNKNQTKLNKFLDVIVYLYEPSTIPIFIQSVKAIGKNKYKVKIVGTESLIEKVKNLSEN